MVVATAKMESSRLDNGSPRTWSLLKLSITSTCGLVPQNFTLDTCHFYGKHMFSSRTREGLPIFLLHQLEILFPLVLGRLAHGSLWNPAQLFIQDLAGGHVLALELCEQVPRVWPSVFQTCGFDIQSITTCTALGNTKLSCGNKCMDWYKPLFRSSSFWMSIGISFPNFFLLCVIFRTISVRIHSRFVLWSQKSSKAWNPMLL